MSKLIKFAFILMLGVSMWSIGAFIFGGTKSIPEKVKGKTETELIDFAKSVYGNIKSGNMRAFAAQVYDLKHAGLKDSYDYLRYISLADHPDWSVEKRPGENGYFITFKTPDGTRAYILADQKNQQWKFIYAGQ